MCVGSQSFRGNKGDNPARKRSAFVDRVGSTDAAEMHSKSVHKKTSRHNSNVIIPAEV